MGLSLRYGVVPTIRRMPIWRALRQGPKFGIDLFGGPENKDYSGVVWGKY